MNPTTYKQSLSARYYIINDTMESYCLQENTSLANFFETGLVRRLMKEADKDLHKRKLLKIHHQ